MKRLVCVFTALSIMFAFSMSAFSQWKGYGDLNCDGKINSTDALLVLMHSTKVKVLTGDALKAADVSCDGKVNSSDALLILRYSVGEINSFPADTNNPDIGHDFY